MKRFEFKLEALLRVRREREAEAARGLATIEGRRAALETRLRQHQRTMHMQNQTMASALTGLLAIDELRGRATVAIQAGRTAHALARELATVYEHRREARALLVDAQRERRALEIIRETQYEQWRAGRRREEAAAMDDMALRQRGRTRRQTS